MICRGIMIGAALAGRAPDVQPLDCRVHFPLTSSMGLWVVTTV
jgi:hypothetical protein